MKDNVCRIIKINRDALFEFVYENVISQQEALLDIESSVEVTNHFDIDWNTGEFIFMAHNSEDHEDNIISLPKDIDFKKVMSRIPATTASALAPGKNYVDYTFEELSELSKG